SAPATFRVSVGKSEPAALTASDHGVSSEWGRLEVFEQTFTGKGVRINASEARDFDGFCRFEIDLLQVADSVDVRSLCLEIPLKHDHAKMIEAPVEWMWKDWEQSTNLLPEKQGRLWDSKRFPFAVRQRKGNMPPFCWIGDDERGICFSCASDEGMY